MSARHRSYGLPGGDDARDGAASRRRWAEFAVLIARFRAATFGAAFDRDALLREVNMIIEVADFRPGPDHMETFEETMAELVPVISSTPGYHGHTVQRSIETPGRYVLIVRWETLEAHMVGFRESERFVEWRERLGSMREGAVAEHFDTVLSNSWVLDS
jgi:heme-degrading monooxygenase HmoA